MVTKTLLANILLVLSQTPVTDSSRSRDPKFGLRTTSAFSQDDGASSPFSNALEDFEKDWNQDWEHINEEGQEIQSSLLQVPCGLQQSHEETDMDCKIQPVNAFVDTGAQVTVLSKRAAQRARLLHLLDRRYAGHATGVGQCRVLGRIPAKALLIHMGNALVPGPAITVLESTGTDGVDLLLGLDFLRDHAAVLSLHEEEMKLFCDTATPVVIPFVRPRSQYDRSQAVNEPCVTSTSNELQESEPSDIDDFFGDVAFPERVDLSGV